jgi:putative FmdB family regulatory protein
VPLYEYECKACGHRFERIQKFSDPLVKKCPECGKPRVHKLLSAPAVQFKGTGWYITDYQRKGSSTAMPEGAAPDKDKKEAGREPASGKEPAGKESPKKGAKKN